MLPFELTKDTPYLALSGELWSVFCEYFNRNWPCYKGFLLYWLFVLEYLISFEVQLQIHASVNYSIIGTIIGLPPLQHHAITWTNADLLSIGS